MKIATRITLLVLTAVVFILAPVVVQSRYKDQFKEQFKKTAARVIPLPAVETHTGGVRRGVGQAFPVAGQDEAEDPGIVLQAPDDCEVGELVRFNAVDSNVDGLTWRIIPPTPDFEIIEAGRRAFFSARNESAGQSFLVIVAGAKDGVPFLKHHTIDILGDAPDPGPETLSSVVRRWVRKVGDYEGRMSHGLALSGVFRKLATAEDIDIDQILEATATANSAVLGDDLDQWIPFFEDLGQALDELKADKKLTTRAEYKIAWLAIADGIEKGL